MTPPMSYFDKTYHPPGTAPGTLISSNESEENVSIRLIDYTTQEYQAKELVSPDECQPYLNEQSITWIHLQGNVHADTLKNIGDIFKLHSLALEDIANRGQRPKVEEYDEQIFMILAMPHTRNGQPEIEQVSIFLGANYVISFHNGEQDPFHPLRQRLRKKGGRIRQQGADYLLYCILDLAIDQGFPVLESFGEEIESTEEEILNFSAKQSSLTKVYEMRRELLLLRRSLWPQREVINTLLRGDNTLIKEGSLVYLRDCYDHTTQILDLIENYREMASSLIDVYLSSANHRLSEIMRVLTMIATIFIPLTFVVGLYGMNFNHPNSPWSMPELGWYYGYPMVWGVMLFIVVGMFIYFKRKNWL